MRSSQGLVRLPRPRRTSRLARHKDYDEFVRAHNDRVEAGRAAGPRLVLVSAVTSGTGLGWNDVLAVARGEAEFEQLQQQRDEERLRADGGPLGLIGSRTVALMLGWSESAVIQMHQRDTGFPRAVIKLNAQSGWVADDIRA